MMNDNKPRVYSYTRFSSTAQAYGDSERRQMEAIKLAEKFAAENGRVLDDSLRMVDRGLSGFHGTNKTKGALGEFVRNVESGRVPRGSILLVENIDRLTRLPFLKAVEIVNCILKNGITIETLDPRHTYTEDSVNSGDHYLLVAHIERGYREGKRKSDLATANWSQSRRVSGGERKLTAKSPSWIKFVPIKERNRVVRHEVHLIPEAVDAVRLIFKFKLEGFGTGAITKKLNENPSVWTPEKQRKSQRSTGWMESYIKKILHNRAVLGEFQPHRFENGKRVKAGEPKQNYFPAIITADVFNAVQRKLKENSNGQAGGRTGVFNNVLRHLAKCGHCAASMTLIDKGKSAKGGLYLKCDSARRSVPLLDGAGNAKRCNTKPVRYTEVLQTVLDNITKVRPEDLLPAPDDQASQSKKLRIRLDGLNGEREALGGKKKNIVANMANISDPEFLQMCHKLFQDFRDKDKELAASIAEAESTLAQMERGRDTLEEWLKGLEGLKKAIVTNSDARSRLNAHLKEFIDRIEIFPTGHEDDLERAYEVMQENPELLRSPAFKSFRKYVAHRLGSVDGRCFRVHFKGGAERLARMTPLDKKTKKAVARKTTTSGEPPKLVTYTGIQIAPPGSLAYRVEIHGTERTSSGPEISQLFEEFFDARKPGFVPKGSALEKVDPRSKIT